MIDRQDYDQRDELPDCRVLRQGSGTVKRGRHCTVCDVTMPKGTVYTEYVGMEDGMFVHHLCCLGLCPRIERKCPKCGGTGAYSYTGYPQVCPSCRGEGSVRKPDEVAF